ncbi:hypothetical protein TNCV_2449301 [Trichonephila clavipes]|uniref:Uncharacterized protein n=1 Tax=Trichonephila clavipes TaxID=2585209 RepID=A0A8X6VHC0_TRICX|nr:hypothetical protein TNCV_2449301 [Trichonephila clavipes]
MDLFQGEGVVTSSMGVNSHLPIHNRFYGFTSWSRTRTTPVDCPWIFMINQLGSDQCTWPWGHCLLSELREWRQQTGRHNGLKEFGAPLTIGEAYLKIIMSSFLGFCEWNTRNRWRDGQVCPDVDKELWRLGPDGSEKRRGDPKGEVEEQGTRESGRENGRKETERESGERESEARLDRERRGDPKGEVEEKGTRESGEERTDREREETERD